MTGVIWWEEFVSTSNRNLNEPTRFLVNDSAGQVTAQGLSGPFLVVYRWACGISVSVFWFGIAIAGHITSSHF